MGALLAKKNGVVGLLLGIAAVIVLWVAWAYWGVGLMHRVALKGTGLKGTANIAESYATAGQIGDLFGGVNALFAALACVGVFWAGWLQRLQLEDARHAYAAERAAGDLKESEAFFFQLLGIVRSVCDGIVFKSPVNYTAPLYVDGMVDYMLSVYFFRRSESGEYVSDKDRFEALSESLHPVFEANLPAMVAFFRVVFQLFAWLDAQEMMSMQKKSAYADIARAHLSSGFSTLLGLFAIRPEGVYFREAVERYGLLEHAMGGDHCRQALRYFYPPAAFGGEG